MYYAYQKFTLLFMFGLYFSLRSKFSISALYLGIK